MRQIENIGNPFPINGIHVVASRVSQPPKTCVNAVNVRSFDNLEDRARGGNRPGLSTYLANTFAGASRIQDINYTTIIVNSAAGHERANKAMAISNGSIQMFIRSPAAVTTAVNGTKQLNTSSPYIFSTELFGKIYITDGQNYQVWDAAGNEAADWSPTAGSLPGTPGNTNTNTSGKLIETWDGRVVVAGLDSDPHNWFMTAKGDPDDIDYAPANSTEIQAVTGGVGVVGVMPDIINCMIPYSDDILIFGCDHSIYQMSGNPMSGGRVDNVTTRVGMPFGRPWCKDPEGNVFFFSSLGDMYRMPPYGAKPVKVSDAVHPILKNTDLSTNLIRLEWNDAYEGVNLWITPLSNGAAVHWFWDARTSAWWKDQYANNAYNPIAVKLYDGDEVDDRIVLMGGEDGKIRYFNASVANDDGTVFPAHATIGPFMGGDNRAVRQIITGIQTRSDLDGNDIKYEILIGDTPEAAQDSEAATFVGEGTLSAGFSLRQNPMKGGYFTYIKMGTNNATKAWALEIIDLTVETVLTDPGRMKG